MSLRSQDYAELSADSYKKPDARDGDEDGSISVGGVTYKVIDYMDRPSGYQGTIYQCMDTNEIVVAHRGTEFDKGLKAAIQDGIWTDGSMVTQRVNHQANDAIELTKRALDFAQQYAARNPSGVPPEVSVTGHSLGGTLAEITAHHFNLRGETFNAYGAASLDRRIPEGGDHVVNHVMAGDAVSSASPHYGQVRIYATRHDIDVLTSHGYSKEHSLSGGHGALGAAKAMASDHFMTNFLNRDSDGMPHRSVLRDPQARLFAQQDMNMIAAYRHDVQALRMGITVGARGLQGLAEDAIDAARGPLAAGEPAKRALSTSEAPRMTTLEQARQTLTPLASTASDQRLDAANVDTWTANLHSTAHVPEPNVARGVVAASPANVPPSEPVNAPAAMLRPFGDPTHPQHGMYTELEKLLPAGTSPERLTQATATCHQVGIDKPQDLASIIGSGNTILFTSRSAVCQIGEMNMGQPAPSIQQTMQQVRQFDQQHEQHHVQFHSQQAQANTHSQQGQTPVGR